MAKGDFKNKPWKPLACLKCPAYDPNFDISPNRVCSFQNVCNEPKAWAKHNDPIVSDFFGNPPLVDGHYVIPLTK